MPQANKFGGGSFYVNKGKPKVGLKQARTNSCLNEFSRQAAFGSGCVKTFWSWFDSQDWNENRAPTQISGLLSNQTLADFT